MTDMHCTFPNREEAIIASLYDNFPDEGREAFGAHLPGCAACTAELAELRGVRRQLEHWSVASPQSSVTSPRLSVGSRQSWWQEVPMWARAAAAVLCIGAAAGMANIHVTRSSDGTTVSTGWMATPIDKAIGDQPSAISNPDPSPWRADLAALESQLRTEFRSADSSSAQTMSVARSSENTSADSDMYRRVRGLIEDSERRQQRELALRVGQVLKDVNAQRQSDLRKIDSNLGVIQTNTGAEVMRQRQLLMNYLVRVSSQK